MLLLRKIKESQFILINLFSFPIFSFFRSIVRQRLPTITVSLFVNASIDQSVHLPCPPPYLKLKVQFMKVVPPNNFIACMKVHCCCQMEHLTQFGQSLLFGDGFCCCFDFSLRYLPSLVASFTSYSGS